MDRSDTSAYNEQAAADDACDRCGGPGLRQCSQCGQWLCNDCLPWPLGQCDECFGEVVVEAEE